LSRLVQSKKRFPVKVFFDYEKSASADFFLSTNDVGHDDGKNIEFIGAVKVVNGLGS
jgi:hypothetical protein